MTRFRALLIVCALFLASCAMAAPGIIGGTVKNDWDDSLIGAQVYVVGQPFFTIVGYLNGSYELNGLPAGRYDVLYRHAAYDSLLVRNVPVAEDSTTIIHVILNLAGVEGAGIDTVFLEPLMDSTPALKNDSTGADFDLK
jgi:hypothetical protein